jgi:hypothetical protein
MSAGVDGANSRKAVKTISTDKKAILSSPFNKYGLPETIWII